MAVLVSLACLHMVPAHAQSTAPRNAHAALPEVVVSGSRQEQAADELPLSYDVINANTLSNQQSRNLREALENLPNTSVKRSPARFSVGGATASAGRDGNVGINIRGLGGNRVLLMTDGVSDDLAAPSLDGFTQVIHRQIQQRSRRQARRWLTHELTHWATPLHSDDKTVAVVFRE